MKPLLTSQQTAFFSQNGYLELSGISFDSELIFSSIHEALKSSPLGRDLWRKEKTLSTLLLRTLSPIVLALTKDAPRLALDQWLLPQDLPKNISSMQHFFCIQGINLLALFCESPNLITPSSFPPSPFPSQPANILFIKPNVLIDWSPVIEASSPLYLAAYSFALQSVYVRNPKDRAFQLLRELGYEYGDLLEEACHPLVVKKNA